MDHSRVNISSLAISCAVMGLSSMTDDVSGMLYQIAARLYHPSRGSPCAFIVWSDTQSGAGQLLEGYITHAGFGALYTTGGADNPHTGNVIRVVTWRVEHEPFKAWYAKQRQAKLGRVGT